MPTGDWEYRAAEDLGTDDTSASSVSFYEGSFTVPPREVWHVMSLWAEYTTSAGVAGTRAPRLLIRDVADDIIMEFAPGATLIAGQQREFLFAPGVPDLAAYRDTDLMMTPIPAGLLLRPGWEIVFQSSADTSDTDGDSDTMVLQLLYGVQNIMSTADGVQQTSDQPTASDL